MAADIPYPRFFHTLGVERDRPQGCLGGVLVPVYETHARHMTITATEAVIARLSTGARSFSVAEARRAGLDHRRLTRLVAAGQLVRLAPGQYAMSQPDESSYDHHVRRTKALLHRLGASAVASHHSALALARLPLVDADLRTVHLTYRRGRARHSRSGYVLHPAGGRPLADDEMSVTVADALVGAGLVGSRRTVLVAGDAALASGLTDAPALVEALDRRRGTNGIVAVRAALAALDPRSESPGESLCRDDLIAAGFDIEVQPTIHCRGRALRSDFRIRGSRVLVEFDGMGKYQQASDVRSEKDREEKLRADGWIIVRFMWQDLGNLEEIRRRVEWALASEPAPRPARR